MNDNEFKFWSWEEIDEAMESRPDWVIPGLIAGGSTSITGKSEAGKSMLCTALIYSLATGRPFLDRKPARTYTPALLGTDDNAPIEYSKRIAKIGPGVADEVRKNLRVFTSPGLMSQAAWGRLFTAFSESGSDFLIIDNASQMLEDGNSPGEINRLFAGIRLFTHAGFPVVIVNHQNQQSYLSETTAAKGISGNSNWTRNVRHRLSLDKVMDKGKDTYRRKLYVNGNYSEGEVLDLEMPRGIKTPVYKLTKAPQKRDPETLDKNADIARWIKANCPGESIRKQAEKAAAQFPGLSEGTIRNRLAGNGPIAQVLKQL